MITIALQKPILNPIAAFDATLGTEYSFNVNGGDAWLGVLITIKDNTTPSNADIKIFTTTPTNVGVITEDVLTNGHQYQATIQTTTSSTEAGMTDSNTSQASNSVSFNCYTQPTFRFTNLDPDSIIASSMYAFDVEYRQIEGEYLSTYQVILYDEYDIEIKNSGVLNAPEQTILDDVVSCDIVYNIDGFLDGQSRKIIIKGITMGGTRLETPLISFTVDYSDMEKYTEIYAINHCDEGSITVGSGLDIIKGRSYSEPVIFYPNEADLRNNGVVWTNVIDTDNFSVFLQFRAPIKENPHLILTSYDGIISETTLYLTKIYDKFVYNNIIGTTIAYTDTGNVSQTINTIYEVSTQELDNVNYTIDSTIYGFMIRRVGGVYTTKLTMLREPIEALSNHYIYTIESEDIEVEDNNGNINVIDGLSGEDALSDGNITLTKTKNVSIADISTNGNIVIGNYEDNSWLTSVYLSDDRDDITIKFKLGSATEPKDIEDLEEGDTYLWAYTDDATIDLQPNNFEIIGDVLYFYPDGKEN